MSSQAPTYLLDKNVARKAITGIAKAELGQSLTKEEADCLSLLLKAKRRNLRLFVSVEISNILRRFSEKPEVQIFLASVEVMQAGRYFKRWARRLREYGFTREDAKILGLGTFGTDGAGNILGVQAIITFDRPFINNYKAHLASLEDRLKAMTGDLLPPFRDAALPSVTRPEEVLALVK